VLAAVELGARGIGVDLNPENIERARRAAVRAGVVHRVTFRRADFYDVDVSEATVVVLYLLRHVNLELRDHLRGQLRPGARLVSRNFDMDDWEPHDQIASGAEKIYCWRIGEK
jgi:SAM-dependent methyltransferase